MKFTVELPRLRVRHEPVVVRSYVLNPQTRVKDLRTGVETADAQSVLDGDLDHFLSAALARQAP